MHTTFADRIGGGSRRTRTRPALACEGLEGRLLLTSLITDIKQLGTDLTAIYQKSEITKPELQAVGSDLMMVGMTATKPPSASSVAALQAEFKVIVAGGPITAAESADLIKDEEAVLVSTGVSTTLAAKTAIDFNVVLTASKITPADAKTILVDVEAIINDLTPPKK